MNNEQQNLSVIEDEGQLTNLRLTDEEMDGIKGGTSNPPLQPPRGGGQGGGGYIGNHNETTTEDDEMEFDDLMLSEAHENDIKAGCPSCNWGPPLINHNETTVSDREDEAQLADLPVADKQAEDVSGGPEYTLTVTDTQTGRRY